MTSYPLHFALIRQRFELCTTAVRFPAKLIRVFFPPQNSQSGFRGPHSFILNGNWCNFPGSKEAGAYFWTCPSSAEVKNWWSYTSCSICPHSIHRDNVTCTLNIARLVIIKWGGWVLHTSQGDRDTFTNSFLSALYTYNQVSIICTDSAVVVELCLQNVSRISCCS